jgi:hypothetical protein
MKHFIQGLGLALAALAFTALTPNSGVRLSRDIPNEPPERFVSVCPERLMPSTIKRIEALQPGTLAPGQKYATVARLTLGWCAQADGGEASCVDAEPDAFADFIIPSRKSAQRVDVDPEDGGNYDSALTVNLERCQTYSCAAFEIEHPGFCARLVATKVVPPPCVIPRCINDGGTWDESLEVDCRQRTQNLEGREEVRWMGCNVMPASTAVGTQCQPVNCEVISGESPTARW